MKTKKQKLHIGDLIGHFLIISTLVGLVALGYWSLKSDTNDRFQSIERLRGDHQTIALTATLT